MKTKIIILFILLMTTSCAKFINKIHRDLDKGQGKQEFRIRKTRKSNDFFARFRNPQYSRDRASYKKPKVQRDYRPIRQVKKRYTTNDLTDNQSDGSLWSGRGNNNYLFSLDQERKNGDIIVINVFDRLKKEIKMELKRSLPASKKRISKKAPDDAHQKPEADKKVAGADEKEKSNSDGAFDKISSVVIEKINKDHFLIRGQKQILFKNKKRLIEIQALVAKRDIEENDTIHSDKLLESNIYIVR